MLFSCRRFDPRRSRSRPRRDTSQSLSCMRGVANGKCWSWQYSRQTEQQTELTMKALAAAVAVAACVSASWPLVVDA